MDFKGVRIVTNHDDPSKQLPFFFFGKNGELCGTDGEILALLQKKFNFSIQWYEGPVEFGAKPEKGGNWTGFIGALINGVLDFSAVPLLFTRPRMDVASPGFGMNKHQMLFTFRKPPSHNSNPFAIFYVFSEGLWTVIIVTSMIFTILITRKSPKNIFSSIGKVTKAMFGQSEFEQSLKLSKRILNFSLALCGAFLYWSYSGTLISTLAVSNYEPPLKSINDFMRKDGFELYIPAGTASYGSVLDAVQESDEVRKRIEPFAYNHTEIQKLLVWLLNKTGPINEAWVTGDSYAKVNLKTLKADRRNVLCEIKTQIVEDIPKMRNGHMFPYNSMLQPLFDRYMLSLFQDGILKRINTAYSSLDDSVNCNDQQNFQVAFGYVQVLFVILGIGGISSIFVLVAEHISSHYNSQKTISRKVLTSLRNLARSNSCPNLKSERKIHG